MDLLNWLIGGTYPEGVSHLHQVLGAYELNGEVFLRLTDGVDVSLNAMNFTRLRVIINLQEAILTRDNSFEIIDLSPEGLLALMDPGVTISYTINTVYGWHAVAVGSICEQ